MDKYQVYADAYNAALKGAVTHYGIVEKEEDYQRLTKFCERAAEDAVASFSRNYANLSK